MHDHRHPAQRAIAVESDPPDEPGFAARVRLVGEHDLATREAVRVALASVDGNVLVDLTACEFVDSTVIGVLLDSASAITRDGRRLELVFPPGRGIWRTLDITGVPTLVPVRLTDGTHEEARPTA